MKGRLRTLLRVVTIALVLLTIATAYVNILSDDRDLRVRAGELARKEAGCDERCKVTGMRGSRGMIDESLEYDFERIGTVVVSCRRAWVVAGDYACEARRR